MKRRTFIGLAGVAGTGLLTAGYVVLPGFGDTVSAILNRQLEGMPLEKGAIETYIKDAENAQIWNRWELSKRAFIRAQYLTDGLLPYNHKYKQLRDELVGSFLLSTDFFYNQMRTDRMITYQRLYNPYLRPCANPFSNLYYKDVPSV